MKKIKRIRIHREGNDTLVLGFVVIGTISLLLWRLETKIPFWIFLTLGCIVYGIIINFFRCPRRSFGTDDTEKLVVAPADGRVVVVEEVDEDTYFHDRRLQVSIFMSLWNVHANWFPVDGKIKMVRHHDGNYHRAWLPKASEENEHADIIITTDDGDDILCKEEEDCYIDEHLGFIKFGSRVDVFLPIGTEVKVKMGQRTWGDETVIAKLQ